MRWRSRGAAAWRRPAARNRSKRRALWEMERPSGSGRDIAPTRDGPPESNPFTRTHICANAQRMRGTYRLISRHWRARSMVGRVPSGPPPKYYGVGCTDASASGRPANGRVQPQGSEQEGAPAFALRASMERSMHRSEIRWVSMSIGSISSIDRRLTAAGLHFFLTQKLTPDLVVRLVGWSVPSSAIEASGLGERRERRASEAASASKHSNPSSDRGRRAPPRDWG